MRANRLCASTHVNTAPEVDDCQIPAWLPNTSLADCQIPAWLGAKHEAASEPNTSLFQSQMPAWLGGKCQPGSEHARQPTVCINARQHRSGGGKHQPGWLPSTRLDGCPNGWLPNTRLDGCQIPPWFRARYQPGSKPIASLAESMCAI